MEELQREIWSWLSNNRPYCRHCETWAERVSGEAKQNFWGDQILDVVIRCHGEEEQYHMHDIPVDGKRLECFSPSFNWSSYSFS